MKRPVAGVILFCVLLVLVTTPRLEAALSRIGGTVNALSALTRGSAIAFGNDVYLAVGSFGTVRGQLLNADGVPVGSMFVIQASANYTHFPRVGFSPHANNGQGAFLVTWHESDLAGGATSVHARLVSLGGALLSADTRIGADGSWWEAGPAVAYATQSREFLVVWHGRFGGANDISGARVSVTGALIANLAISSMPTWERDPSVAYNPTTDEFLVVYAGYSTAGFVNAQRVKAGTGQLLGGPIVLSYGLGMFITDVSYSPASNQFLAAWYQDPPKGVYGRVVAANGSLPGIITPLSLRFRAYDGLSLAFNKNSATGLLISHDAQSYEIGGVQVTAAGLPEGSGTVLTAAGDAPNYYPQAAASTSRPEWVLVAAHNFAHVIGQRLGSDGATAAPPPAPSCSVQPGTTSVSLTGVAQSRTITVTASGSTCQWTASSSASWISITAGSSGTGAGTVTYAVTRNTTGAARTGSISVTGGTVTIQQSASVGNAAVHDMTGDGRSDLMWHNTATGHVALWGLRGHTVTSAYLLTSSAVDTRWKAMGTGDLDGDGYADVVWRHAGGAVACWSMRGGQVATTEFLVGGSPASVATEPDPMWEIRGIGDVDGDGRSDIIWQNMGIGTLRVWFMDGINVRSSANVNATMPDFTWKIAGAGDLNFDGKADIIWQNHSTGNLGAWLLDGATVLGQSHLSIPRVPDLNWKVRGVGDTNGDGYADLIWQNIGTGGLAVWYMYGVSVLESQWMSIGAVPDANWAVVGPG